MATFDFPDAIRSYVEQLVRDEAEFRAKCEQRLLASGYDPATTVLDIVTEVITIDGNPPFDPEVGWSREVRVKMTPYVRVLPLDSDNQRLRP